MQRGERVQEELERHARIGAQAEEEVERLRARDVEHI